jgi:hypothetical protein
MNLVNFLARMVSISSACLILIEKRMEFIEGSMKTASSAVRVMRSGLRSTSGEVLFYLTMNIRSNGLRGIRDHTLLRLLDYGREVNFAVEAMKI